MLIRRHVLFSAAAAVALALVAMAVTLAAAREERGARVSQAAAQRVSHQVSGLLVLTQEYARHNEARAAQQWHQRHGAIEALLAGQPAASATVAHRELVAASHALPELFHQLETMPEGGNEFSARRREMIIDQLLANAQTMSDSAYQWYQDASTVRDTADHRFEVIAMTVPLAMLLVILTGVWVMKHRVLRPLRILTTATAAVAAGDLSVRIGTQRNDEFGQLKRRFDGMTEALAAGRALLDRSERQLRAVTDNSPALIAYLDVDETFRFANGHYRTVYGIEPSSLIGRTLKDHLGDAVYAEVRTHVEAVLGGQPRSYERHATERGLDAYFHVSYVPDVDAQGVNGFYVMVLDVTARKRAEFAQQRSERLLRLIANNLPVLISYFDLDARFRFANDQYRRTFGVDPKALIGATVVEGLGEVNGRAVLPILQRAMGGQAQRLEREVQIGGTALVLQSDYIPDTAADGTVQGVFAMAVDISELKRTQLAHARGEERLRTITDNLPALIAYVDTQERLTFVNAQIAQVLGTDMQSALGKHLQDVPRFPYAEVAQHVKAALRGEAQSFEGLRPMVDGPRHLQSNYIPDKGPQGEVRGFYAMTFDVTEQRAAEARLKSSERLLRDITNRIPAMVGYFDRDERCLFANQTVLQIHGIAEADTTSHTLRSGLGEASYALHAPHIRHVLGGQTRQFEGHVQHLGRDAHFQAHLIPDSAADGAVKGFYVMSFDVTAMRRAEQARAKSEQTLRQITDNLPVLISYVDKDQKLTFANATYRHWLGLDPKTLLGRHVRDAVGPHLHGPRQRFLEQALRGERVEFENEAMTPRGLRTTQTVYVPDIDAEGQVLGLYALSSDVTQLKEAELQLRALARSDPLTGLPNRLSFNERFPQALARQARNRDCLALFFLDIDRFKSINDSLGHAAGDAVLTEFAQRLLSCVRKTDTVARLAGDEFVIILEGLRASQEASAVANKIISAVRAPFELRDRQLSVTTSIGIAYQAAGARVETASELLNKADVALYEAKGAGRDNYHLTEVGA